MKLNENGDFCLLYVEPADEKQTVFETIGTQTRPVVLMLPLAAGQTRSKLFQRPEDFSDLKYVRRQTGVSIIFVTAGSELLMQMATRYGFPAYSSIDALADMLAHGRRPEHSSGIHPRTNSVPRIRTGPLVPSAAQLAAIQHAMPSGPQIAAIQKTAISPASSDQADISWSDSAESPVPVERVAVAPLNTPPDLAFWPPAPGSKAAERDPVTPLPSTTVHAADQHAPVIAARGDESFLREKPAFPQPRHSEIPARRSALQPSEQYTTHQVRRQNWDTEEDVYETPTRPLTDRHSVPSPRTPIPPVLSRRVTTDLSPRVSDQPQRSRSAPNLPAQPIARASAMRSAPNLPPVKPPAQKKEQPRRGISPVLLLLSLLILAGAGLGSFVVITRNTPTAAPAAVQVGTASFLSSEQINDNTSQGLDDEIQISLRGLSQPAAGKSYYAWLLGDLNQTESQSILLGKLNVSNGSAKLLYLGDAQHTNLLLMTSRFLVTEEASGTIPLLPTPDTREWRYYGAIPATPDPSDPHHFAFLNHLRHLLADEPVLDQFELPGGLGKWLTQNVEELVQWASNARDQWQSNNFTAVRNQGLRILSYLDGMSFMVQDIPPASINAKPTLDARLAGLGLLNVRGPNQNPPSDMDELAYHLNGLLNSPDSPANARSIVTSIQPVMANVNTWLESLRSDDKQLLALTNAQIDQQQAFSLLDDMVLQASNAYSGSTNPATGQFQPGASWMHQELQAIATINISTYTAGSSVPELGPSSSSNAPSSSLPLLNEWVKMLEDLS